MGAVASCSRFLLTCAVFLMTSPHSKVLHASGQHHLSRCGDQHVKTAHRSTFLNECTVSFHHASASMRGAALLQGTTRSCVSVLMCALFNANLEVWFNTNMR